MTNTEERLEALEEQVQTLGTTLRQLWHVVELLAGIDNSPNPDTQED